MILTTILLWAAAGGRAEGELSAHEHPYETEALRVPRLSTGGAALIRGVTVHSAVAPARVADVLVLDGDIAAVGAGLAAPAGVALIEGAGKHLTPGAIDTHSHMAIDGGVNEGTLSITADCDISDVIDPDDLALYRALAGGTTTIQCLHGSANVIGGRSEVLKLRWPARADELRFPDAPQGIKLALGENPKRANWGEAGLRFPGSRMGVEAVLQRGFERARQYAAEQAAYEAGRARGEDPAPPRRDVRLEVLAGILAGSVQVHAHCYRADEIVMLLRAAESFGFRIRTLQHVLEGYKVAREIAAHGAGTSTFSDWFGYKLEAYDAIPENAALLDEAGVLSTINSDSDELVRHLFHEAAKSVRYAGLDRVRALRLATLNGAMQLGIDERVGSIEVGKDADLVLWNGDPLSVYARVEWTMVDGEIEFQRRDAFGLDRPAPEPVAIVEAAAAQGAPPAAGPLLALVGGTAHTVTGPALEDATLLIQGGRIVGLGQALAPPAGAEVIDVRGQHLWPGLIALDTRLGLQEISSVRGSLDQGEIGGNQPDIRVTSSIHADSAHIPITRSAGVTRAQVAPEGGGPILGQSAVIRLAGDTWEELLTLDRDMLHVAFPRVGNRDEEKEEPEAVAELRRSLSEARQYGRLQEEAAAQGVAPPPWDPRLAALAPFAQGRGRVALHADNAQTILNAIRFAREEGLDALLYGGAEAWKVAAALARADLPVVLGPVLALPRSELDPYDAPYACAAVLQRAGVRFAITPNDGSNVRNIGFHAGTAAAFGLPREEALRAVTLYPARLLGLEAELGSLAVGKRADVVVTDGDLLEPTTRVLRVLIDGEFQDPGNRQTQLYERYRERLLGTDR